MQDAEVTKSLQCIEQINVKYEIIIIIIIIIIISCGASVVEKIIFTYFINL